MLSMSKQTIRPVGHDEGLALFIEEIRKYISDKPDIRKEAYRLIRNFSDEYSTLREVHEKRKAQIVQSYRQKIKQLNHQDNS